MEMFYDLDFGVSCMDLYTYQNSLNFTLNVYCWKYKKKLLQ